MEANETGREQRTVITSESGALPVTWARAALRMSANPVFLLHQHPPLTQPLCNYEFALSLSGEIYYADLSCGNNLCRCDIRVRPSAVNCTRSIHSGCYVMYRDQGLIQKSERDKIRLTPSGSARRGPDAVVKAACLESRRSQVRTPLWLSNFKETTFS